MDQSENTQEELAKALHQLRWLVHSFQLSGIENWLKRPGHIRPVTEESFPQDSLLREKSTPQELLLEEKNLPERDSGRLLSEIRQELGDCKRCRLHQGRTHIVFGEGSPGAPLVFVGEGPGQDEDRQGRPFVGRAGKLLDKIIRAIGFRRDEVYICNIVKCRPPKNRTPEKDEIATCFPFLTQQLEAIRPKIICALGAPAAQTLLNKREPISRLRSKIHYWRGIPLVATFHPAYLLRTPSQKAAVWQDLVEIQRLLRSNNLG
jgi:DNA polymerase